MSSDNTTRSDPTGVPTAAPEHLEVERKLEVPTAWKLPELVGVGGVSQVGPAVRLDQRATYFDCPQLALLAAKHTLRRRTGGTDPGWHLKKPDTGQGRPEVTAPLGSPARVPLALRAEVNAVVGPVLLAPVCQLNTVRIRRELRTGEGEGGGQVIALIEDDAVEATALRTGLVRRWRELEVELVDGSVAALDAIVQALIDSGCRVSASASKLGRALAGQAAESGDGSVATAGEQVQRYLIAQVGMLQALEPSVRQDAPDAVHKARVATRRMRATLRSFAPVLERSASTALAEELRWLTGLLGAPRDGEVLRERLGAALAGLEPGLVRGPVAARMESTLRARHERAHAELIAGLDSVRFEKLSAQMVDYVQRPLRGDLAQRPPAAVLPGVVAEVSAAVIRAAEAVPARQAQMPMTQRFEALHRVRKRAKAARYALEVAGEAAGTGAGEAVAAWTGVQDLLGEHQDSALAQAVLAQLAQEALAAGEPSDTYELLMDHEARCARAVEEHVDDALSQALQLTRSSSLE